MIQEVRHETLQDSLNGRIISMLRANQISLLKSTTFFYNLFSILLVNSQLFASSLANWVFRGFRIESELPVFTHGPRSFRIKIKMVSAQHSSNNGKNWQKLSYQKILLAW